MFKMGFFDKLQAALGYQQKEARILLVGLDNSGKTTMIQHLKPQETSVMEVVPTVGFQVEEFKRKGVKFTIFDMSGQDKYRSIWENYYQDVQAIIFVIDCADKIRMCVAKDELDTLLSHDDLVRAEIPILCLANKRDKQGALSAMDCVGLMELERITDKPWHCVATNALDGKGVEPALNWLVDQLDTLNRRK